LLLRILLSAILKRPVLLLRVLLAVLERAALERTVLLLRDLALVAIVAVEAFFVVIILVDIFAPRAALFVEAGAAFAQHAEIMVRELQIIFGLDTVAGELRITRHAFVFFEQLRRIATLPLIAGIAPAAVATHSGGTLSTTTATAAVLTIVDQRVGPRHMALRRARSCPSARSPFPEAGRACVGTAASDVPRALALGRPMSSGVGRRVP
jgi:hypothetical protein